MSHVFEEPGPLTRARELLEVGEVVALPTDTVYGLGARADLPDAAETIFSLKGRPETVALPVLVGHLDQARGLIASEVADAVLFEALAAAFWPGPLTIVARRNGQCRFRLGGDETTIGLRQPAEPIIEKLALKVGPLAVTSANLHHAPPCTSASAVSAVFGGSLYVLDGGVRNGTPSTVVSVIDGELVVLRAGALSIESLRKATAR